VSWVTDNAVFLKLAPAKILALTAYGEARGEGAEGMMAVLNTIRNRTFDRSFWDNAIYNATGSPWHAVALKERQFSVFNFGDVNRPILVSLAERFDSAIGTDLKLAQAYHLALMLLQGTLTDNTGGAVYYHEKSIMPSWASSYINLGMVGNHIFYATKDSLERFRQAVASVVSTIGEEDWWLWIVPIAIGAWILLGSRRRRS